MYSKIALRAAARSAAVPVQEVELERREEAFGHRVVPAVAGPAEAGANAVALQHLGVRLRRVLRFRDAQRKETPRRPAGAFYEDVVRMLQTPGGYVVLDDEGRLSLTDDGKKVVQGGDFILGR